MRFARTPLCIPLLAFATWLAVAPLAAAQDEVPKVVVLRFEGWRSDTAREAVLTEIASYVELVSEERAVATAEELGVDVSTPEGMQQVVEHLGVTMVIAGAVEGRAARAETTIVVVDSQANELSRRTGPSPLRGSDRTLIGAAALEAIQEAQAVLTRQADEEREAAAAAVAAAAAQDQAQQEEQQQEQEESAASSAWNQRMLVVLGGLRLRNIGSYVSDSGNRLHYFESDVYPEIDLHAVVRPLVDFEQEDLRGLLFALQGSFSAGINYVRADGTERGMTSFRFRLDVGYGYTIEDIFEIVGTVGVGVDGFALDDPDSYASATYTHLRPAVMGRFRAYEDLVIVEAGLGGRIGIDGGDIAAAFGPSLFFGGVDLFIGLMGRIDLGLTWTARFGYTHYALSFSGIGGSLAAGNSGTDEAIDIRLLLGYSL